MAEPGIAFADVGAPNARCVGDSIGSNAVGANAVIIVLKPDDRVAASMSTRTISTDVARAVSGRRSRSEFSGDSLFSTTR